MRGRYSMVMAAVGAVALGGCETAGDPRYARQYALVGPAGQSLGTLSAWESPGAVGMRVQARGLAHGLHGVHIHGVGRCDGPKFESAGGHWNPAARKHGLDSPQGPHGGDLPNLSVAANGVVSQSMVLSGASLAALADADGSALVIHAVADDHRTDPSGNSGDRVACAVTAPAAG